MKDKAN